MEWQPAAFCSVICICTIYKILHLAIQSVTICPSKTGCIMLCPLSICLSACLSVHLSVNFSCPLRNSDTIQDIFMKLGTNINHSQTKCREQEPTLHLHFLRNHGPLKFLAWKSCPLYNFDTAKNIFMKLRRNINHHQTMCREQESLLHLQFLRNYTPLKFLV